MARKNNFSAEEALLFDQKKIPYSQESEQAVLGTILIDPESISYALSNLDEECFYIEKHRQIYECMTDMYNLSQPIEGLLLLERMKEKAYYAGDEDKTYILSLAEAASGIGNIRYYVDILKEKAMLRRVITACGKVMGLSYENNEITNVLDIAEREIYAIKNGKNTGSLHTLRDVVKETMEVMDEMSKDETGKYQPVKANISAFDNFLGGFNNSDLVILAARPGVGKTAFALNVAYNIAESENYSPKKTVVFFSLEMANAQLAKRIISSQLHIDNAKLRLGDLDDGEWKDLYEFWHDTLPHVSFLMDDTPNITVMEIKSNLRKVKNLGLVVIDYLQLIDSGKKNYEGRVQEVSEMTRSLKIMAKELNVPVILLSQLNRGVEQRKKEEKIPRLSDLRDAGSIEQDADIVIFLSRPDLSDGEDAAQSNICDVYIAKNRHGQTGTVRLHWDGAHTNFSTMSYENVPES